MSQFLPEPQQQQQQQGVVFASAPEASAGDVALMQRVFAAAMNAPNLIPEGFMSYLLDYMQTQRLSVPIGQVFGYQNSVAAIVAQSLASSLSGTQISAGTTSCSHLFGGGDPEVDTAGPSMTISVAGNYVFVASFKNDSSFPDGSHDELVLSTGLTCYSAHVSNTSVAAIGLAACTAGQVITSTMKLCVGGSGSPFTAAMSGAQFVAIRYA